MSKNDEWMKAQCARHRDGICMSMDCIKRGGYVRGYPMDRGFATCTPNEILRELECLRKTKTK